MGPRAAWLRDVEIGTMITDRHAGVRLNPSWETTMTGRRPLLLGSGSRAQIGPHDISASHRRRLPGVGFLRCVSAAPSRSESRSASVLAWSRAYVSMSAAIRIRRRSSSQWPMASRASVVAGRWALLDSCFNSSYVSSWQRHMKFACQAVCHGSLLYFVA